MSRSHSSMGQLLLSLFLWPIELTSLAALDWGEKCVTGCFCAEKIGYKACQRLFVARHALQECAANRVASSSSSRRRREAQPKAEKFDAAVTVAVVVVVFACSLHLLDSQPQIQRNSLPKWRRLFQNSQHSFSCHITMMTMSSPCCQSS